MDTKILEDFGLTNSEIRVYLTILETGTCSARQIINKSGLQSSVVYRALDSLSEKGLIGHILEGKRKTYQSINPEHFLNYIDEKREQYKKILPELKKRQLLAEKEGKAIIYKGIRGVKEVYTILRNAKAKEYLTFGGGKPCEDLLGTAWWLNHHMKRIENKLPARQVYDLTVKKIGMRLLKKPLTKIRFLPAKFAHFQETAIVGDYVAISIFTENPYSILIKDKIVAEGYKKHFELMWETAK
ncbi:hypothetical protein KY341_03785 [Candidatus Woesearchaeota archaeon]|nr:hypothetical protein [Candidatus Woesearchaeota archaeon]